MDISKRVSQTIKNKYPSTYDKYRRQEYARIIARKMWANVNRVKEWGTRLPNGETSKIPRELLNAMCFGCGDGQNRRMIKKYTEAAKAAERFLRRRSR